MEKEDKVYKTQEQVNKETALVKNASFAKTKTVAFKHMLDLADDPSRLADMADKWDGSNLRDTLHPSQMLLEDDDEEQMSELRGRHDDGDGSSCCSY